MLIGETMCVGQIVYETWCIIWSIICKFVLNDKNLLIILKIIIKN